LHYIIKILILCFLCVACSTRQHTENFEGATEQLLVSYAIDNSISKISSNPFLYLSGKQIHLEFFSIIERQFYITKYIKQKIKMALKENFHCVFINDLKKADISLKFFFGCIGTDFEEFGFQIPETQIFNVGISEINIFTYSMYRGIVDYSCYHTDLKTGKTSKFGTFRVEIENDKLKLPFCSIPFN
jgi:hypothetical protein